MSSYTPVENVEAKATDLSVVLPVCPVCEHIGKIPFENFGGRITCSGPIAAPHRRVNMKPVRFEGVAE